MRYCSTRREVFVRLVRDYIKEEGECGIQHSLLFKKFAFENYGEVRHALDVLESKMKIVSKLRPTRRGKPATIYFDVDAYIRMDKAQREAA